MKVMSFIVMMLILAGMPFSVNAADEQKIKGVYIKLPDFKSVFDGKKVEVLEFFSFYCGHCYEFEKSIAVIKGNFPKKIKWKNVPIAWENSSMKPGEAYLLAEEEGKGEEMKKALFETMFIEKRDISDISVLESIGTRLGLGFDFSRRLRAGDKGNVAKAALITANAYSIEETPTLIIAGNLKVDMGMVNHNMDFFRDNTITIIKGILKK